MRALRVRAQVVANAPRGLPVPGPRAAQVLLRWYDREARVLPWRTRRGKPDPYRVWLSEIMLQQTTVKAVIPYYSAFLARWPTVQALAATGLDDVLAAWAGLGYYSRARNLHNCARIVTGEHAGRFPDTEAGLLALPGIGPYTAAAMAAIAFGRPATPVDGNIERVVARLFAVEQPLPASKPALRKLARELTPAHRAGDHAQAMMDLGAMICTPRQPACGRCPVRADCRAKALEIAASLPRRAAKPARPVRKGSAFVALRDDGHVLLRRRPEKGLLGGMLEVPSSPWEAAPAAPRPCADAAPLAGNWRAVPGVVVHTFTHFRLEMSVYRLSVATRRHKSRRDSAGDFQWVARGDLDRVALPSVMRKIIAHGLNALPEKRS
jgi:A/G-specific adenine glycosylase